MSTGFYFTCCCGGGRYEAWSELVSDQFAIDRLVQKVGEASNSSGEFAPDDEYNANYLCSMQREDSVFLMEVDSLVSPTEMSVARYDAETGALQWEHSSSASTASSDYVVYGATLGGGKFSINATQAWHHGEKLLFESSGVTAETATPNTTTDPLDGASAAWVPNKMSSHDFPKCAGYRIVWSGSNFSYSHTTPTGGGTYQHFYDFDCESTLQIGIGSYGTSTGNMTGVSVAHSVSHTMAKVGWVETGSSTPPGTAPSDISDLDGVTVLAPGFVPIGGAAVPPAVNLYVEHFSSMDSDYAIAYAYRKDADAEYTNNAKLVIDGVVKDEWESSDYDPFTGPQPTRELAVNSVAVAHDSPSDSSFARFLVTYTDRSSGTTYHIQGYNAAGTSLWSQSLNELSRVVSVCDTWALVYSPLDKATETGYDGKDWSGISSPVTITHWLVKLDESEWEPCRIEATATGWSNPTVLTTGAQIVDLVKSTSHPYGLPADTYGTTPP